MLSFLHRKISTIHSAALILGAAGFLSKLLGLLRDRMLAGHFGASRQLDIYYAAFQVPDFIYTVLLLGAGSMVIIPIFAEILERGKHDAEKFIDSLFSFFVLFSGALMLVAMIYAPLIVPKLFPGFTSSDLDILITITRILFISPFFLGISGILSAPVQVHQRFIAYALSSLMYNVGIIFGIMVFVPVYGVYGLVGGVLLGAFLHVFVQFNTYRSIGFSLRFSLSFFSSEVRRVFYLAIPRILSLSFGQIASIVLIGIASTLRPGSITVFQFANNLGFLPIGVFAISYATALFPRLSRDAVGKHKESFLDNIFFGVRTILFWVVPIAFLFVVLRAHIVRVVLGAGAFSWSDTRLTAAAFAILAVALIGESMNGLFLRGFYALKATWMPFLFNVLALSCGIGGAFVFVHVLVAYPYIADVIYSLLRISDLSRGEVLGIVMGSALGTILNAIFLGAALSFLIKKKMPQYIQTESWRTLWLPVIKIVSASLGASMSAYGVLYLLAKVILLDSFIHVLAEGIAAGGIGALVYVLLLYSMRSDDLIAFSQSLKKKFFNMRVLPQEWNGDTHTLEQ